MVAEDIVDDCARLGHHVAVFLNHRRLTERVDPSQCGRRLPGCRVTPMLLNLIWKPEFFQQPKDALRTGVIEMVDDDHTNPP